MKRAIALCAGLLALAGPAAAQSPVAVVEEVQGKVTGAEFMDYVAPKTVIKVPAGGSVTISYMKSCQREKISGLGTVIIGTEESFVQFSDVKREKTDCDSSQAHATTKATSEAAATVLRSLGDKSDKSAPKIQTQLTVYGTSPIVEAKGKGTLVVERLDVKGERQQIELNGSQQKGKFYDFASANKTLTPGGVYSATFGTSKIVFQVDANAKPGAAPVVGRLIRLN
ncbi:hypothetical protein [Bradyrhizobium sp.]|uniref:hypothetical protein n=1 Tax=Bradyrhizobium sp. TaxID=376 RepID=UPI001DAF0387|nr:hypothetical protein [Bradyrhizobium sp.]MBI5318457.1 hypothetical protein [Bradyrhizobium sp.]